MDSRLGNLSFTGCNVGRDSQLAATRSGGSGSEKCGCCGANCVHTPGVVCSTCRRQGSDSSYDKEWRDRVAAAIAAEPARPKRFWE